MPAKSKRLQVIERIVTVLRAIQEGDGYWKSPKEVRKPSSRQVMGYPSFMVYPDNGGDIVMHMDAQNTETFYVIVEGAVQEEEDIVTPLEHSVQDVRKAIKVDFDSTAADSLRGLASDVYPDAPPEVEYYDGDNGMFARFKQRVRIQIYGEFGEL